MEEMALMFGLWFAWAAGIAFGWWCRGRVRDHIEECISRYHREKEPEARSQEPKGERQKSESTTETRRHGEKTADTGLMNQTPAKVKTRAAATTGKKERTTTTTPDRTTAAPDIVDRWLARYSEEHGQFFSKRKLAKRVGVHESTIYQWKSGTYKPSLRLIGKIADVFGVTVDEFLAGPEEGEQKSESTTETRRHGEKTKAVDRAGARPAPTEVKTRAVAAGNNKRITPQQELSIGQQFIGAQLDSWMTAKVKSHDDVSSATGISRNDLTRLIDNQIRATGDEIFRLAETFRVTVERFLEGPGEEDEIIDDGDVRGTVESRYKLHV